MPVTDNRGNPIVLHGLMSDRPRELDDGAVPADVQEEIDRDVRRQQEEARGAPRPDPPKIVAILALLAFGGVSWAIYALTGGAVTVYGVVFIGVVVYAIFAMVTLPFRRRFYTAGQAAPVIAAFLERKRCPACGYDLTGSEPQADGCTVCPECGAAWKMPSAPPPVQ